jgi:hypothetical protein
VTIMQSAVLVMARMYLIRRQLVDSVPTGKPFCHSRESGNANSIYGDSRDPGNLFLLNKNLKKVTF